MVELAVLELDPRAVRQLLEEAHLDLARPRRVGLDLPLRTDVPAEDHARGRLERDHARPVALAAVLAAVVDAPADTRLEHPLDDWTAVRAVSVLIFASSLRKWLPTVSVA